VFFSAVFLSLYHFIYIFQYATYAASFSLHELNLHIYMSGVYVILWFVAGGTTGIKMGASYFTDTACYLPYASHSLL